MTDRTRPFEIDDLVWLKNAGDDWDGWIGVIALREGEVRRTEPHLDALGRLRVDLDRRPGAYADAPYGCLEQMPLPYMITTGGWSAAQRCQLATQLDTNAETLQRVWGSNRWQFRLWAMQHDAFQAKQETWELSGWWSALSIEALIERMLIRAIRRPAELPPDARCVGRADVVAARWLRSDQAAECPEFYVAERPGYIALWFAPGQDLDDPSAVLSPRTITRPLP